MFTIVQTIGQGIVKVEGYRDSQGGHVPPWYTPHRIEAWRRSLMERSGLRRSLAAALLLTASLPTLANASIVGAAERVS